MKLKFIKENQLDELNSLWENHSAALSALMLESAEKAVAGLVLGAGVVVAAGFFVDFGCRFFRNKMKKEEP